ncbi:hypothetical protein HJG60_010104 [Phyllostomus discolor]|uniref:Uncharacterized protein n=1 Tax=Phyllostomus discolor TaxID=89673 RepID=A0A834EMI6_9CHIR|nr:hypothetical protein HJG60_010104 [Phyllostomus discolor]
MLFIILLLRKLDMTVSKVAVTLMLCSHIQVALVSGVLNYFVVFRLLKSVYVRVHSLCCTVLWVLTNIRICTYRYSVTQNSFTARKISCAPLTFFIVNVVLLSPEYNLFGIIPFQTVILHSAIDN